MYVKIKIVYRGLGTHSHLFFLLRLPLQWLRRLKIEIWQTLYIVNFQIFHWWANQNLKNFIMETENYFQNLFSIFFDFLFLDIREVIII